MGMFDEFEAQPAKPKRLFDEFSRYDKPVPLAKPKTPTAEERYEAEGGGLAKSLEKGYTALTALMAPAEAMRNRQAASVAALMGAPGALDIATDDTLPQRSLEAGIQRYNTLPKNPLQDNIARAYEAESGIDAPLAAAKELVTSPKLALDYLAEMLPAAVPGGGVGGAGAKITADALLKRAAVPAIIQRAAPLAAAGAGANAGATFSGGLVPNTAGVYEENGGDLANALRVGGTQTAVESAVAAPFGAVLPFGSGVLPTAGKALVVSPADEMAQTYLGNKAIGKETSGGELAASALLGATSSPVDIATALWAARQGEQGQAAPAAPQAAPAQPTVNNPSTKPGMFDEFEADATADPMNPQPKPGAVVETARPQFGAVVETPGPHAVVERPQPRAIVEQPAPRAIVEQPGPRGIVETVPPRGVVETAQPQFAEPPAPDGIDLPPPDSAPAIQQPAAEDVELRDLTEGLIRQMRDAKQLDLDHTLRRAIDRIKTGGVNEKPAYFAKLAKEFEKKGDAKTAGMLGQVATTLKARQKATAAPAQPKAPKPMKTGVQTADEFSESSRKQFLRTVKAMGGITVDEARDVTGEPAHVANRMLPGLFNARGNGMDLVARRLHEAGYISDQDYNDVDGGVQAARDLIGQALSKEFVGTPEQQQTLAELQAKEADAHAELQGEQERALVAEILGADLSDDEFAMLHGGISLDEEQAAQDAYRATQQEQDDEQSRGIEGQAGEARPRGAETGTQGGEGEPRRAESQGEDFALSQQTERDLADREAEIARREAEVAKREREAADKARADRERDDFTLTGSDRAADEAAARGQQDIFSQPARENTVDVMQQAIDKVGAKEFKSFVDLHMEQFDGEELEPAERAAEIEGVARRVMEGAYDVPKRNETTAPKQEAKESQPAKIDDLGEKIGGARKDTAGKTGPRGDKAAIETAEDVPTWRKRFTIAEQLPKTGEYVDPDAPKKYVIFDNRTKKPLRGQGYRPVEFASIEAAEKAVPLYAVAMKHRVTLTSRSDETPAYEIWRDVTERKRVKVVEQQFASRDDAMRYMAEHAAEILATKTGFGEEILAVPEKVMRRGKDRRSSPVKGQDFMDAFGFRGVEFGNWNNQAERQEVMNHAYDALLDLAEVLAVPPKALSLNGDLGLAFGARGQGLSGAKAHYETDYGTINLTKMSGAGSLAHEWFHAADHYFGRQDGKAKATREADKRGNMVYDSKGAADMASHGFKVNNSGVREEVRAAYTKLIQTMFRKAEQYVEDTQQADKFVGDARGRLEAELKKIRNHLASQLDEKYYKRNNKPASAEQLAEFDRLADLLVEGQDLATSFRYPEAGKTNKRNPLAGGRWTNDTLEAMSGILKAVRGRQGFNAEKSGWLDGLRYLMQVYGQRVAMLESARNADVKTKQVPTNYAMEAKKIDQGRVTDYWTTEHEMAARAFSAYVEDKIAADDGKSDFLAFGSNNDMLAYRMFNVRPFPEGAERVAINQAFDEFFGVLQTRETDSGIALFRRTEAARDAGPVSQVELDAVVERVAAGWKRAQGDGARLIGVDAVADLPVAILRAADAQNVPQEEIKGVFHKGHIYLVRENLTSASDAEETIFHEAYGHLGALMLNGNDRQKLHAALNDVWNRIGALDGVRKTADRFGVLDQVEPYIKSLATADMPMETKRRVIVDELLAHVAGRGDFTLKEQAKAYVGAMRVALRNAARALGLVGIAQTLDGYTDSELLWNLKQMRAAVVSGKTGKGGETLFARRTPAGPNSPQQPLRLQPGKGFDIDAETRAEWIQRRHQDKMNRWAKVQRQIAEQGGTVELDQDVYHAMERMTGRAADRIDSFTHETVRPLLKRVAELKTNLEEVGTYLMALGASDRNAYIQSIRQDMPGNGSGMSDAEAAQILADYRKRPDFAAFDALARDFQALTDRKLKVLVGGGVISQQQAADMKRAFGFYVPYKGFETIDEEGNRTGGTGAGYSTPKRFTKQAFGRVSKAGQVVENIVRDYEQAVILAEKANVGRYVRNLAQSNPDPTLWTVDLPPSQPALVNGVVQMRQAGFDNENEIRFIENGQEVRIQLHDTLLAETYNNLGQEPLTFLMKAGDTLNRFLRQTYTQKNPAFILVNAVRDVQTGMALMTAEMGAKSAVKALRHTAGAWKTTSAEAMKRGSVTGEWAKYMDAYRKSGAQTAYYAIEDIEAKQAKLNELLAREGGNGFGWAWKQHGVKGLGQMALYRSYNNALVDVIEALNGGFENMMRLSAFRQYIDEHGGIDNASRETLAEASRIAKNLTVNFNRKGEKTRGMNALYLFWNANVQGTQNLYRAAMSSTHKGQVRAAIGGMVGLGFLMAMATDDEDDDLTPGYLKDTSIVIHIGDGKRIQIPLAYGLGAFVAMGYEAGMLAKGARTPARTAINLLATTLQHFSPLGNPIHDGKADVKDVAVMAAPTILKVPAMLATNRNGMGYDVVPKFDEDAPDRPAMRNATRGSVFDSAAGGLDAVGLDVSPESLKLTTQFLTGGLGTFITDSANAGFVAARGEFDAEKTPILKRFYGENDVEEHRSRFYELAKDVKDQASEQGRKQKEFFGSNKARDSVMDFTKQMKELRAREGAASDAGKPRTVERLRTQQIKLADAFKKEHDRMVKKGMIEPR